MKHMFEMLSSDKRVWCRMAGQFLGESRNFDKLNNFWQTKQAQKIATYHSLNKTPYEFSRFVLQKN